MPIVYRTDVRRQYHAFIADGMARYADHKAMKAGQQIAEALLSGTLDGALSNPNAFTYETEPARAMRLLRDHAVTPGQLLARVAEVFAYFEDHRDRLPSQRFEDHMLARAVLTIAPWRGRFRAGAKLLRHTGAMIRERLGPWAVAFTRKLRQDVDARNALVRVSASWDG
jgi:hypothetical protein